LAASPRPPCTVLLLSTLEQRYRTSDRAEKPAPPSARGAGLLISEARSKAHPPRPSGRTTTVGWNPFGRKHPARPAGCSRATPTDLNRPPLRPVADERLCRITGLTRRTVTRFSERAGCWTRPPSSRVRAV
jgi:hypothetical protein